MPSIRTVVGAAAVGAVGEYFLDPHHGRRRRHVARDKALSWIHRTRRKAARVVQRAASEVAGKAQRISHELNGEGRDPSRFNDPALKAKVESIVFRPADVPKGSINVNVENRVVYLRGQVPNERMIERLVHEIEAIEGVREVHTLLHEPRATPSMKL
jgi:osmotically-inducible protein OsmY